MGKRHRTLIPGPALFFTTASTLERKIYFQDKMIFDAIQDELFKTAKMKNGFLMGYVIMPNHLHLLIGFIEGGNGLIEFMHTFKGAIRKKLFGNQRLWERGFDDLEIKTMGQFNIKLNYIHNNPVKREMVASPEKWEYSSYKFWCLAEANPHLVKDFKWIGIEDFK